MEFDIEGNIRWDRTYGGNNSEALVHIEKTRDFGYLLVGESNSVPSGNKSAKNIGDRDYWLVKIDSIGNMNWDFTYGGTGLDAGRTAHQNEDGNFLIGGISGSNASGDKTENCRGNYDFWMLLIDEFGNLKWDLTYGGEDNDGLTDIFPVQDGGIILGGNSASMASGDKTQDNQGANDIWILKTACKIDLGLGNDTLVCSRSDLYFDVRQPNCLDCNYLWENGTNSAVRTIHPKQSKDIHIYISSKSGCEFRDSIHIEVMPSPEMVYTKNTPPRCHGESNGAIQIESVIGGLDPLLTSINGSELSDLDYFEQLKADNYLLTIEDVNGCRLDSLITLEDTPPLYLRIDGGGVFKLGDSTKLKPIFSSSVDTFFWDQSNTLSCHHCLNPYAKPMATSNYLFTIINDKGCKEKHSVTVAIKKDRPIYFPTAFSPNGDGDNEFYRFYPGPGIKNINYFKIFDRWGELLYSRKDWDIGLGELGWDGYFRGQKMSIGQYVYIAEIEFIDGWVEPYKGYFILLR